MGHTEVAYDALPASLKALGEPLGEPLRTLHAIADDSVSARRHREKRESRLKEPFTCKEFAGAQPRTRRCSIVGGEPAVSVERCAATSRIVGVAPKAAVA